MSAYYNEIDPFAAQWLRNLIAEGLVAPHIRQRLYWVADDNGARFSGGYHRSSKVASTGNTRAGSAPFGGSASSRGLADNNNDGRRAQTGRGFCNGEYNAQSCRVAGWMEHSGGIGRDAGGQNNTQHDRKQFDTAGGTGGNSPWSRSAHGFWRDSDWLFGRDGLWRPVEPGTFPLAHGVPARVGRLRGYGNAIVPQVAAEFIRAFQDARRSA